ncbi:MAG TPA: hypothetical protein VFD60_13290 [Nitrososphaeraceae archaeon]|jgi:hypothetical protein|nr:hypothetical protein [Nitrososphaeraceae archaeon]
MTPEAYNAVKEWMDFRASFGEEITGESWILRNTWQKVKPRYGHRIGLANIQDSSKVRELRPWWVGRYISKESGRNLLMWQGRRIMSGKRCMTSTSLTNLISFS